MGLLWKFLKWLLGGAAALLMFFAGVGPQEAASHISEWLKLVGIEQIPPWLANKSTDRWAFLIGLIGLVAWGLIIWLLPWLKQARVTAPSEWRGYLPWGILWDFEGFLGANRKDGVTHIACFQIKGVNRTKRFIQLKSAHIVSCITSRQIQVHMKTDSGYAPLNEANPIPRKAQFRMQGLFYDPNSIKAGDREGIREDEFLRDFSEFIFEAEYDGKRFTKTFNAANISAELNRLKPEQLSTPRVTKKATTPPALDNPLPTKRAFVDEGKIRLIDHVFKHIRSQCLPQYDRYCDSTIGPWKHMLLEASTKQFSENAWANIQESSSG